MLHIIRKHKGSQHGANSLGTEATRTGSLSDSLREFDIVYEGKDLTKIFFVHLVGSVGWMFFVWDFFDYLFLERRISKPTIVLYNTRYLNCIKLG